MKKEYLDAIEAILSDEYARGYNDGIEITEAKDYEQGLNDAWKCARSIVDNEVPYDFWDLASGQSNLAVFKHYSAKGAIEKCKEYKEYKEKQKQTDDEIKVGDEIYSLDKNYKSVVTAVFDTCRGVTAVYFTQNGKWCGDLLENLHKTGRHFPQITEVLKQMQEGKE